MKSKYEKSCDINYYDLPNFIDATYFRLASYHAGTEDPPLPMPVYEANFRRLASTRNTDIFMSCGKIEKS